MGVRHAHVFLQRGRGSHFALEKCGHSGLGRKIDVSHLVG